MKQTRQTLEVPIYQWGIDKDIPIIFENIETESQKETHAVTHLMPSSAEFHTLNTTENRGIFQINLHTPQNKGALIADALAEEIIKLYPVGLKENKACIYKPVERTQGRIIDGQYTISISIYYSKES